MRQFVRLILDANTGDLPKPIIRVINQLQENIDKAISPITSKSQNDSQILTNIKLLAGQINQVSHLLNKPLTGWKVIRQRQNSIIWDSQDTNTNQSQTLLLNASNTCTVDIEVF